MNLIDALREVTSSIKNWADENKVQKVSGKGLSSNDYTTADKNKVAAIPNDLVVLDGKLYLAQDGVTLNDSAVTLPSGGGSGGGTSSDIITLVNKLSSPYIISTIGGDTYLEFEYSSTEDPTGNGMAYVYVGDVLKMTKKIITGYNRLNIGECIVNEINEIKLTCMDQYGNSKNLRYTVEAVSLQLSSLFDDTIPYNSEINYTYTPTANMTKTVHFILDGKEIGTQEVTTSGREEQYIIPKQPHGSHMLEVYFTVRINDEDVPSNRLYHDLICVTDGATTPIISCSYRNAQLTQFDTIVIPYFVYSPTYLTSDITLSANGKEVNKLTVGRGKQTWSFRVDEYGELVLTISCGTVVKNLNFNVNKSDINVSATTSNLELYLSSYGRNNNEKNPATWEYRDIFTEFSNFNFSSDGWQLDDDGITVLRVSGDARLEIPYKIFNNDCKITGKTIEIEFMAREVLDYEAVIMSCMYGGRGIQITAQRADLFSQKASIGTQYKENEHVRLSFVIEKKNENCFLLVYVNGVLSSAEVYSLSDDFEQASPVNISIGSNYCTTDIYCIRVYNNSLTRYQILDNWIADTQSSSLLIDRYSRNQIYNTYGAITIDKLPADLPYMIINAAALPADKEDSKKTCSGSYVDVVNPDRSFTFNGASIKVQGTSSQYYYVKNYKLKFKNGFKFNDGSTSSTYQLNENSIGTNEFTFKADVASSEGANNVILAQIYNDLCPTLTPPQQKDPRVRQTIDGHPIVIFWDNGSEIKFLGKYNFNNDKGTAEVFGFSDGDESWEIRENGNDLVGWRSDDFSSGWEKSFEARYPEDNTDISKLNALSTWLVSTNTDAATNGTLSSPVTYDGVRYTTDSKEYRLAKFRAELPDHADIDALVFYYVITEIFLCIDQREKNAFPTLFSEMGKWIMFFYDADSSLGIDNKGKLAFSPFLEDIDYTAAGDPIYNGQRSVLWVNLRKAYYPEIMEMYKDLRTTLRNDGTADTLISYDVVNRAFEKHQSKWCEAIFNEDMYRKCLEPMIVLGDGQYIPMLLGKKEMQRKWWLYNRFRFLDSKYVTGNSMDTRIMIRSKSKANVTLTPYINMYGHVYYNSDMVEHRMESGKSYEYVWSASGAEDAVIGINDADMLTSLGDLAPLHVETIDIAKATHLTSLKIGDASPSYSNKSLTSVVLGNNTLLRTIDLRNCETLDISLGVSGCSNIEEIYCEGTSITGIDLPNGGIIKVLHLPDTITNLTICNQPFLTDFVLNNSSKLTTLRLESVGSLIDAPGIINQMNDASRIRALNIDWEVNSESDLVALLNKLNKMKGIDENDNNLDKAVLTGRIRVNEKVSDETVGKFYEYFSDVVIDDGSEEIYILNYKDLDGRILYSTRVAEGASAIDPIKTINPETGKPYVNMPEPIETDTYRYEFIGWSTLPTNITRHYIIIAQYHTKFAIKFFADENDVEPFYRQWSVQGDAAEDPVKTGAISAPTKEGTSDISYKFSGWDNLPTNVQASISVYAQYDTYWAARFWNDNKIHYTEWVLNGNDAVAPSTSIDHAYVDPTRTSTVSTDYTFNKWASRWGGTKKWLTLNEFNQLVDSGDTNITAADFTNMTSARDYIVVYKETTRKYIVGFYDDSGTLIPNYEYEVSYGSVPSKVPSGTQIKHGVENPDEYMFKGWYPSPSEVITGETVYKPLFKFTGYLFGRLGKTPEDDRGYGTVDNPNWTKINAYWNTIASDITSYKNGTLSEDNFFAKYPIGGRMLIQSSLYALETSAISIVEKPIIDVEIIGHNHDDLSDGSGKAPLTFFCLDLPEIIYWMNPTQTNIGGWEACALRTFTNGELFDSLPDELKAILKPVYKISDGGGGNRTLVSVVDKCWLASADEIGASGQQNALVGQGEVYSSVFTDNQSRKKYLINTASFERWRLRSTDYPGETSFLRVTNNSGGLYSDNGANNGIMTSGSYYIAFGFCI